VDFAGCDAAEKPPYSYTFVIPTGIKTGESR
jgi:hypothetical protein